MPLPKNLHHDLEARRVWIAERRTKVDEFDRLVGKGLAPCKAARQLGTTPTGISQFRASVERLEEQDQPDGEPRLSGRSMSERIDLGLALLSIANPGHGVDRPREALTAREIAAWCDCSHAAIQSIERRALRTLHRRLNALLREQVITADFGGDRLRALLSDAA